MEAARAVKAAGAHILRGGAFKPRTQPVRLPGAMGEKGLHILGSGPRGDRPADRHRGDGRRATSSSSPDYADILQIGARNMQNFTLLDEVGQAGKPVLLSAASRRTIEEWLLAAEYILSHGNRDVILCERGIRTFETATRNTLRHQRDPARQAAVATCRSSPTRATARASGTSSSPMALAAIAAGADGLMIEVHPNPDHALSDGAQSLTPKNFGILSRDKEGGGGAGPQAGGAGGTGSAGGTQGELEPKRIRTNKRAGRVMTRPYIRLLHRRRDRDRLVLRDGPLDLVDEVALQPEQRVGVRHAFGSGITRPSWWKNCTEVLAREPGSRYLLRGNADGFRVLSPSCGACLSHSRVRREQHEAFVARGVEQRGSLSVSEILQDDALQFGAFGVVGCRIWRPS